MINENEITDQMVERKIFKSVINSSIICILVVIVCFAAMCFLVNEKNGICQIDLDLFGDENRMPAIMLDSNSVKTDGIDFNVDSCSFDHENKTLCVEVSGKNTTDEAWQADGRTFAVAVQCVKEIELTEYFYNISSDWVNAAAPAGGSFSVKLNFRIEDADEMLECGDIISLVLLRGSNSATVFIVLNDLIDE